MNSIFFLFFFVFFSIDQTPSSSRFLDSLSYPHFLSMAILVMFGCSFFLQNNAHTHKQFSCSVQKKKKERNCVAISILSPHLFYINNDAVKVRREKKRIERLECHLLYTRAVGWPLKMQKKKNLSPRLCVNLGLCLLFRNPWNWINGWMDLVNFPLFLL